MPSLLLQIPCFLSAMLPGYGFSPFPDFQPHLHTFRCRAETPSMWIPGSAESQTLSEAQEDRPLLHPCHHKHVAVCQQETLAFIELQPPVTPKLNGLGSSRPAVPEVNGFRHTLNELQNGCCRTDGEHEAELDLDCESVGGAELECHNSIRTEKPPAVTTVCRPLHAALSLPLSFPLSSLYSYEPPPSPSSHEGPDSCQPQRRTSQGSVKKSIREHEVCLIADSPTLYLHRLNLKNASSCFQGERCRFIPRTAQVMSLSARS